MTDASMDEFGPVDYLVIEFPAGQATFNGEMAAELASLSEAGIIRILDLVVIVKDADGNIEGFEIDDFDQARRAPSPRNRDRRDPCRRRPRAPRRGDGTGYDCRCPRLGEHLGHAVRGCGPPCRWPTRGQRTHSHPSDRCVDRSRRRLSHAITTRTPRPTRSRRSTCRTHRRRRRHCCCRLERSQPPSGPPPTLTRASRPVEPSSTQVGDGSIGVSTVDVQQPEFEGALDRSAPTGDQQLAIDRDRVGLDGVARHVQMVADLRQGAVRGQLFEHPVFGGCQVDDSVVDCGSHSVRAIRSAQRCKTMASGSRGSCLWASRNRRRAVACSPRIERGIGEDQVKMDVARARAPSRGC